MSAITMNQLRSEIFARYTLFPTEKWLNNFLLTVQNSKHPLAALTSTAKFRLLATDFTSSLSTARQQIFADNASDLNIKESTLAIDIPVQVLDIQDVSTSKWSQIEAIDRVERGEEIKGREVIRTVAGASDENDNEVAGEGTTQQIQASSNNQASRKGSSGPHKLLLQDAAGNKVWAFELARIDRITIVNQNPPTNGTVVPIEGLQIGCKMLLRKGTKIRRGLIMLTPANTAIMGGKVEIWDKQWRESRKARLNQLLEAAATA